MDLFVNNDIPYQEVTIKRAKEVELKCTEILQKRSPDWMYAVATFEYECYDIFGRDEDNRQFELIEVKERRSNDWDTWFIEEQKINRMLAKRVESERIGLACECFLLIVSDNKKQLYNIDDIINEGEVKTIYMNKTTAEGFRDQGKKVPKEVYEFNKDIKHDEL